MQSHCPEPWRGAREVRERKSHTEEARPCQRSSGGSVKEASINKDSRLNRETDLSEAT